MPLQPSVPDQSPSDRTPSSGTERAARPSRPQRPVTPAVVVRTEQLTPHMVRVILGGDGLAGFDPTPFTDRYVKLQFPPEVDGQRPRLRTYTVRRHDPQAQQIAVDFVLHGDDGLAGPWAAGAQPGDRIDLLGPGGAYAPPLAAPWHLLIGDESALPAIAAALEELPTGARAKVFLEVAGAQEQHRLQTGAVSADAGELVTWVHREGQGDLASTVMAWDFPAETPSVFLHGDAGFVRDLRRYLRAEHGVQPADLSASGYWRRGRTEEGWRSEKADWKAAVELDDAALTR